MEPAIHYARHGFPVSPKVALNWRLTAHEYQQMNHAELAPWFATFMSQGRTPNVGEIWRSEEHALTLEAIATSTADAFYEGRIATMIDAFARENGGFLRLDDLASHTSEWVDPITITYQGFEVAEIPPNSQGIVALQALNILEAFEPSQARDEVTTIHRQIEALKLAFADAQAYLGDPHHHTFPLQALLSKRYAGERSKLIIERARLPAPGNPLQGGTVYLAAADGDTMVSFIQSNYLAFGSGIVVPGTGIALQNRGASFNLTDNHPNLYAPNKRPYHTIMPGFLSRDGQAVGPFGVMGGFMQPQGHVQVVTNLVDYLMNPQTAIDAPRFQWMKGLEVNLEHHFPKHVAQGLMACGHKVAIDPDVSGYGFGRGQIIWRTRDNVLIGASDGRADGQAVGY
jgi:gamma-glutamyltranspeptidase/glutathione hydrolase